jgi:hypothetical protein
MCGVAFPRSEPVPSQPVESIRFPERFVPVIGDYEKLTGAKLGPETLVHFIELSSTSVLSQVDPKKRFRAGQMARKNLGHGKFSLNPDEWLKMVYEIPSDAVPSRVWITGAGDRYHASRDCRGMKSGQEYAISKGKEKLNPQFVKLRRAAFELGLSPCLVCKPPKYSAGS